MKWTYSNISDLIKAYDKANGDIAKVAELMGLSKSVAGSAVYRFIKKESPHYKRRIKASIYKPRYGGR